MNTPRQQETTSAEVAWAAGLNLLTHMSWVQRRAPEMMVQEDDQLVIVDSGLPCDTFNVVCRARLPDNAAAHRFAAAIEYFRAMRRPFSWWVGPTDLPANLGDVLRAAGLEAAESEVAMMADLAALQPELPPFPGLRIERVGTPEELQTFAELSAANWEPPDLDVVRFYNAAAPFLLAADSPISLYLGYLCDRPVATAELTESRVVGLYNISTLAEKRRLGIGSAMVWRMLTDARAKGYGTAVLQASAQGVALYARLGFVATGRLTEYKPPGARS